MRRIGPAFLLVVIASTAPLTVPSRVIVGPAVPPFSLGEIVSIVNRPLDNIYESRYPHGFCTEELPIIQLTTNDVKMFFTRGKCRPVLGRGPIPALRDAASNQSRGVILTKSGDCFHWHLIKRQYFYLDSGKFMPLSSVERDQNRRKVWG